MGSLLFCDLCHLLGLSQNNWKSFSATALGFLVVPSHICLKKLGSLLFCDLRHLLGLSQNNWKPFSATALGFLVVPSHICLKKLGSLLFCDLCHLLGLSQKRDSSGPLDLSSLSTAPETGGPTATSAPTTFWEEPFRSLVTHYLFVFSGRKSVFGPVKES